jgi:hypothetical protein
MNASSQSHVGPARPSSATRPSGDTTRSWSSARAECSFRVQHAKVRKGWEHVAEIWLLPDAEAFP